MSTNFKVYEKAIKEANYAFGFDGKKIFSCEECNAGTSCIFDKTRCEDARIEWLYKEARPILTKNEKMFCMITKCNWIARDRNGMVRAFEEKPEKFSDNDKWSPILYGLCVNNAFADCDFFFIKWEDEEPWDIEDLLKLEVIE